MTINVGPGTSGGMLSHPLEGMMIAEPPPAQEEMGFFTDSTLCIGCKACEVACKQWNMLPSDGMDWSGKSYDNTLHLGATTWRVLWRHVLPATAGFIRTQFTLFLPACILAEATMSFAGLGFPDDLPSWGTLLQDAANVGVLATAPWLLAPAVAIFSVVLAVNLAVESSGARFDRIPRSA